MHAHNPGHLGHGDIQRDRVSPLRPHRLRRFSPSNVSKHLQTFTNASRTLSTGQWKVKAFSFRWFVSHSFLRFILTLFSTLSMSLARLILKICNRRGIITCLSWKLNSYFFRYVDKFTEFLHSFVRNHLRRFEGNTKFPILEFLSLLFKYTFEQTR